MTETYDGVVASTGPSLEIDRKRAADAIDKIKRVYGSIEGYNGLWIAAGTLGGQDPETAQRTRIYNQFLEAGIKEDQIREIGGEDTMDKVREIISLSESETLRTIGISTYFLHHLRFVEGLRFAKKEGFAPKDLEFKLIWSPTTPWTRWHKDLVHGVMGLGMETLRLSMRGFGGAQPDYKPLIKINEPVKRWTSDSRGL